MEQLLVFIGVGCIFGAAIANDTIQKNKREKAAREAEIAYYDPNKREKKRRIVVSSYMRAV